jgi:hypothetical protein
MSLRDADFSSNPAEPLPPGQEIVVCRQCGRRFAAQLELATGSALRPLAEDTAVQEYVGICAQCRDDLDSLAAPPSDFSVAFELLNLCERVRGHVGSGMDRDAAIAWVVDSQMAAEDADHPQFLRFLRDRNLVDH